MIDRAMNVYFSKVDEAGVKDLTNLLENIYREDYKKNNQ